MICPKCWKICKRFFRITLKLDGEPVWRWSMCPVTPLDICRSPLTTRLTLLWRLFRSPPWTLLDGRVRIMRRKWSRRWLYRLLDLLQLFEHVCLLKWVRDNSFSERICWQAGKTWRARACARHTCANMRRSTCAAVCVDVGVPGRQMAMICLPVWGR